MFPFLESLSIGTFANSEIPREKTIMQIRSLRIQNYKGFYDSGEINFGPGFNVLVGQNNSGKSAVLEALRLLQWPSKPHRSERVEMGVPLNPAGRFDIKLAFSGRELSSALLSYGSAVQWPVGTAREHNINKAPKKLFKSDDEVVFNLVGTSGNATWSAEQYPSHGLFSSDERVAQVLTPNRDRTDLDIGNISHTSSDNVPQAISSYSATHAYVFDAQRISIGKAIYGDEAVLAPNAGNLPRVLLKMQGNRARFQRFNEHVSDIFPNIFWISVDPVGSEVEIKMWTAPPERERLDLAIELNEGGSGIGQVLAILYVSMSMDNAIICIDEPNSFLHPGASKRLVEILKEYPGNQYIIATHSSGLLVSAEPSTIHLVKWTESGSSISSMDASAIDEMREVLSELGVSLGDVFGPEGIIWVEGETEEVCFPVLCRYSLGSVPRGFRFIALRSTAGVEKNNAKADEAIDLYSRVSRSGVIVAPAIAFSFDRELRSDSQVADLERRPTKTRVIGRRTYENYLLNSQAIAQVISAESGAAVDSGSVEVWIRRNRSRFMPATNQRRGGDVWQVDVDAPRLLAAVFQEMSGATLEYRKRTHSARLTQLVLDNEPQQLKEMLSYVRELATAP